MGLPEEFFNEYMCSKIIKLGRTVFPKVQGTAEEKGGSEF